MTTILPSNLNYIVPQATTETLRRDGFTFAQSVLSPSECETIAIALDDRFGPHKNNPPFRNPGVRDLLNEAPEIGRLAESGPIRSVVVPILGINARPVRGIFFDKTEEANWKVAWHQDLTIAVKNRVEVEGFQAWSIKAGRAHVQPPVKVLESILTVRIHLDDTDESNGALRVLLGSHVHGRLDPDQIQAIKSETAPILCDGKAGDVLLMRPLLLHASSAGTNPCRRRVIHLEFSAEDLPGGLEWYGS